MRGWSALLHQTALNTLVELERLDPDNPIAAMARSIFEVADDEGVKPSGRRPGGVAQTDRQLRAQRHADRMAEARQAADLYATGLSLIEVGAAFGRSPAWVSNGLMRLGIKARPKGPHHGTLDPDRVERLRAMRAEGKTLDQMGAAEHISRERVRQLCTANGIDTSPNLDLDERQLRAVADYMGGDSLEQVAEQYGVGTSAVRNWVIRAGHVPRHRKRRHDAATKAKADRAAKLYRQGLKTREIAAELGMPKPEMIYRLLAIAGVRPSRNSGAGLHRRFA